MIKIILLCSVLAMAAGHVKTIKYNVSMVHINYISQIDDSINLNRLQHSNLLQNYDTKLEYFRNNYLGRVEGVNVQLEMVTTSIIQIKDRLNPLELLSDLSKQCVTKYRVQIPTVTYTETSIKHCVAEATNQVTAMLSYAVNIRNLLEDHYKNDFERNIQICAEKYIGIKENYTSCVTSAMSKTNDFIISNQKNFEIQMDVAECTAKAYMKRALDCSYTVQTSIISEIAVANVMIDNCLVGKDECIPCEAFTCPHSYDLQMDKKSQTILNPFYGKNNHPDCLMLSFK